MIKEKDANHNTQNGSNGTDIIGCRTVSSGPTEKSVFESTKPPALKDETTQPPPVKKVKKEQKSPEIAKSPPILTASVVKQIIKQKDEEIKEFATTTDDDDDDNDSDYPSGRITVIWPWKPLKPLYSYFQ